jgi:hypothetical protein
MADTRLLVLDQPWWRANPLGMLWPEIDAAFVMSGGGNGGHSRGAPAGGRLRRELAPNQPFQQRLELSQSVRRRIVADRIRYYQPAVVN